MLIYRKEKLKRLIMKKRILTILLCLWMVFLVCGCSKRYEESNIKPTEIENVSIDINAVSLTGATITIKDTNKIPYVYGEWYELEKEENGKWYKVDKIDKNYGFNEIGYTVNEKNEVIFVINWSKLYGEIEFGTYRIIKQVDDKYISTSFSLGETSSNVDFYITKSENHNDIRFNDYYATSDRTIYLAGNILEFYIKDIDNNDMTLKTYLSNAFQTIDDGIKSITSELDLDTSLRDGGSKIYKSLDKDITIIVCNTTKGDKNVFIGDYSLEYMDGDCEN